MCILRPQSLRQENSTENNGRKCQYAEFLSATWHTLYYSFVAHTELLEMLNKEVACPNITIDATGAGDLHLLLFG